MFRPAFAIAAALLIAALVMLVLRDRGQAPVEERTAAPIPLEEARRSAEEEHAGAERRQRKTEERVAELERQEAAVVREETPTVEALARLRAERDAAEAQLKEAQQRERAAAIAKAGRNIRGVLGVTRRGWRTGRDGACATAVSKSEFSPTSRRTRSTNSQRRAGSDRIPASSSTSSAVLARPST